MSKKHDAKPSQPAATDNSPASPDYAFEYSPISLWEEDFSGVKNLLDGLRTAGVTDLGAHMDAHPDFIDECQKRIRVLDVNRKTLELFGARSKDELIENLERVFRDDMRHHFRLELEDMWVGKLAYEREGINYSLTGEPITVQIYWRVVPGYEESFARVLVALEDITARKAAEKSLATSEARLRGLFENSPISLWEEDFSGVKHHLDRLRAQGIKDVSAYLEKHPEFVDECEQRIKVLDINRKTLEMFGARSKDELIGNLGSIFRDEMRKHFHDELVDIWSGKLAYDREGINYSLSGKAIDVQIYWRVVPGFESTLERVMVALEDITARKIAEEYLKYLGTHDVMTKTYNRGYFEEELARLKDSRRYPVSIFVADLNNLKITNDSQGHSAGDGLIRRAAEVLQACFRIEDMVARIGGDEFAVVVAEMDEVAAQIALVRIRKMVEMNNNFYLGPVLSLSIGAATGNKDVDLLEVFREADDQMYADKRRSRTNAQ